MPLTLTPLLLDAGVDPSQTLAIRHAFVTEQRWNAYATKGNAAESHFKVALASVRTGLNRN